MHTQIPSTYGFNPDNSDIGFLDISLSVDGVSTKCRRNPGFLVRIIPHKDIICPFLARMRMLNVTLKVTESWGDDGKGSHQGPASSRHVTWSLITSVSNDVQY